MDSTSEIAIYDRQDGLVELGPVTAHVIGCGGVGTWVGLMLAMAGVRRIHLYDNDLIEESNLNRLPYGDMQVGRSKTEALTALLGQLRQNLDIVQHGNFQPLLHKFTGLRPTVICCVDTMRDRQVIYAACQEQGAFYIDVGAESHSCTVSDSPADWSIVDDRAGYFTPIWVAPVVMAASLAVARVMSRVRGTLMASLSTETIRRTEDVQEEQEEARPMVGEPGAGPVIIQGPAANNDAEQPAVPLRIQPVRAPATRRRRTVHERT